MEQLLRESMPTDDQSFLLYFIMGTYFAPDLKGKAPQKSVLQRCAEGLPPYTSDQLAASHMQAVEIERVYYYVLRKADRSVIVKLPWLHQFFHGNLLAQDSTISYPQFDYLFPPHFHPHSWFRNQYKVIGNIVFINKPETYYMNPEDVERFKRLTGLEDFRLDRDRVSLHTCVNGETLYNMSVQEVEHNGELLTHRSLNGSQEMGQLNEFIVPKDLLQHVPAVIRLPYNGMSPNSSVARSGAPNFTSVTCNATFLPFSYAAPLPMEVDPSSEENFGPGMIFLPSHPTKEELRNIVAATKNGSALTGSAATGQIGPALGLIDIGECEDSYLFRVSLPGVKRDEREFSCEVENVGKVLIRGVTVTGEKTVWRHSQMFEMQSQNLCPPGNFSISFKLPGPVDPRHFSGNFGTDGILEGIVMKERQNRL